MSLKGLNPNLELADFTGSLREGWPHRIGERTIGILQKRGEAREDVGGAERNDEAEFPQDSAQCVEPSGSGPQPR